MKPFSQRSSLSSQHEASRENDDLIAMNSPSPQKPVSRKKKGSSVIVLNADLSSTLTNGTTDDADDQDVRNDVVEKESVSKEDQEAGQRLKLKFQDKMQKKDSQMADLDEVSFCRSSSFFERNV